MDDQKRVATIELTGQMLTGLNELLQSTVEDMPLVERQVVVFGLATFLAQLAETVGLPSTPLEEALPVWLLHSPEIAISLSSQHAETKSTLGSEATHGWGTLES